MSENFTQAVERHVAERKQFAADAVQEVHCNHCAAPAGARCLSKGGWFVKPHGARLALLHRLRRVREVTVWACKNCGRCADGASTETCRHCGGTMGQIAESAAMKRFMEYWEPPTGWRDYETLVDDWNNDRVHPDAPVRP